MTDRTSKPVRSSGTFTLGAGSANATQVHRLGYGAMQITGEGVWGEPADRDTCIAVLRRAVDMGVDFIDTADSYGPEVSERLIFEALHPYPDELVIATKAGLTRQGPGQWLPVGRPEYLRQQCELSLRRLRLERIDLFQLHRIDAKVPAEEQFGLLAELVSEGKVRHVGLSQISVAELEEALPIIPVASVQNLYNLGDRSSEDVLEACAGHSIGPVDSVVAETGATPAQVALAWLLHRSPVMLPIPGTKSVDHLEENCEAATLQLTDEQLTSLDVASNVG